MKEFEVEITETLQRTVTVQAENVQEAMKQVRRAYDNEEIILDADNSNIDSEISICTTEPENILTALLVNPQEKPKEIEFNNSLKTFQGLVKGNIEVLASADNDVLFIMNEEGKLNGLPLNRAIYDTEGKLADIIVGSFLVVGTHGDDFGSLTPVQIEKYSKHFEKPEKFTKLAGKIIVQKIEQPKTQTKDKGANSIE